MKKVLIALTLTAFTFGANAQKFAVPLDGFSRLKTSYLHMEDGTTSEGLLSGFKRSKGQIEMVKMKTEDGKKLKIDPAKIKFMYIPPSNLAKLGAANTKFGNVNNWSAPSNMDTELMGKGYVYFEKMTTQIKKKKTEDLMLQMLNASFSSKIKVFYDPFARETVGLEVKGVTVAGGLDKSYYVHKVGSSEPAFRLFKKDYKEQFESLFGDCEEFMTKYGDKIKWSDLEMHIYEYTQMCE